MDSNRIAFLILFFTTILFSSRLFDVRRKRQEFRQNKGIQRSYELQMENQLKASWHKGFQLATGITIFILFMQLVTFLSG